MLEIGKVTYVKLDFSTRIKFTNMKIIFPFEPIVLVFALCFWLTKKENKLI